MSHSINNRILRVDLTEGRTWTEAPGMEFYRKYVGGRMFIAHYLLKELPQGADPLGPENMLIFAAGPVTGTPVPGNARHSVGAKSPMSGLYGESEAGGYWGAELKSAGWDGIIFTGKAEKPVYLWIKDDAVEIRDAAHLWGKITGDVEAELRDELGDNRVRVTQIGPAGENLVRFACVVNDLNEFAGRAGMGAVMGSKNLKAIAVRGSTRPQPADMEPLKRTAQWVARDTFAEGQPHYIFHEYGTGAMVKSQAAGRARDLAQLPRRRARGRGELGRDFDQGERDRADGWLLQLFGELQKTSADRDRQNDRGPQVRRSGIRDAGGDWQQPGRDRHHGGVQERRDGELSGAG